MLNKKLNMACPYCGQHQVEVITEIDPMSFNYHEVTKTMCMFCGKVIEPSEKVTYSNSTDSSYTAVSSKDKFCAYCNTKMEPFGDGSWWSCPKCGYGYMDYIGDLPKTKQFSNEEVEMSKHIFEGKLHIPCDNTWGIGVGKIEPMPYTLQIDTDLIKLKHKEMELEFEFEPDKLENIDTLIINGHRFVRENNEHK